eukprot:12966492-Ditylum_brightwellii.AAC.1
MLHHNMACHVKKKGLSISEMKDLDTIVDKKVKEIIMNYPVIDIHSIKKFKEILLSNNDNKVVISISSSSCKSTISSTSETRLPSKTEA